MAENLNFYNGNILNRFINKGTVRMMSGQVGLKGDNLVVHMLVVNGVFMQDYMHLTY